MELFKIIEILAVFATALGVTFVAFQIWEAKQQVRVVFEDDFTKQYRDVIHRISVHALLGEELDDESFEKDLNEIYNYIDLTNEQIFIRKQRRISSVTWNNWLSGIRTNMNLPAFSKAWTLIKSRTEGNFQELRRLEASGYVEDPADWE